MMSRCRVLTWVLLFSVFLVACARHGDTAPTVRILSPSDGYTILPGETLTVESRVRDDVSISRVELRVNDVPVDVTQVPKGEKSYRLLQHWVAMDLGTFTVSVVAYDSKEQVSDAAAIAVSVSPAQAPTALPVTPLATADASPAGCRYDATFVADVTIPDNTELAPGTEFVKTWRLRNTSTCDWGPGFQFVFVDGARMDGPASVGVAPVPAGATFEVSVRFVAPDQPGTYRSRWRMRTADGGDFGDRPFVLIVVPPPATPTPSLTPTSMPSPRADLDITRVSGNLTPLVGDEMALDVTVVNHGAESAERPVLVRTALWSGLALEGTADAILAGGQAVIRLTYVFDGPTDLETFVVVDPNDEIAESDEENNAEKIRIVVNPPLYAERPFTATAGLRLDLDDEATEEDKLDVEWQVVEGTTYVAPLNGAGVAPLSGDPARVSYALVAGLAWSDRPLALPDLSTDTLFGFRTNAGRVGYARVDALLDAGRTSARFLCRVWDW